MEQGPVPPGQGPVQPALGDPAWAGGLDWGTPRGPFQPRPFWDSVKAAKLSFGCENICSSLSAAPAAELGRAPAGPRSWERGRRFPGAQGHPTSLGLVHRRCRALV